MKVSSNPLSKTNQTRSLGTEAHTRPFNIGLVCELAILLLIFGAHSIHALLFDGTQPNFATHWMFILFNFYIFGGAFIFHLVLSFLKNYKRASYIRMIIRILVWVLFLVNIIENHLYLGHDVSPNDNPNLVYSCLGIYVFLIIQQFSVQDETIKRTIICLSILYSSIRISIPTKDPVLAVYGGLLCLVVVAFNVSIKRYSKSETLTETTSNMEEYLLKMLLSTVEDGYMIIESYESIYYTNQKIADILEYSFEDLALGLGQVKNLHALSSEDRMELKGKVFGTFIQEQEDDHDSDKNGISIITNEQSEKAKGDEPSYSLNPLLVTKKSSMQYLEMPTKHRYHSTSMNSITRFKSFKSTLSKTKKYIKSKESLFRKPSKNEKSKNKYTHNLHLQPTEEHTVKVTIHPVLTKDEIDRKDENDILQDDYRFESEQYLFKDGIFKYFQDLLDSTNPKDIVSIDSSLSIDQLVAAASKPSS